MNAVPELVRHLREEMGKVVVGQDELRNQCVIALLCRGHCAAGGRSRDREDADGEGAVAADGAGVSAGASYFGLDAEPTLWERTFSTWRPARFSCIRARSSPICCWWMK